MKGMGRDCPSSVRVCGTGSGLRRPCRDADRGIIRAAGSLYDGENPAFMEAGRCRGLHDQRRRSCGAWRPVLLLKPRALSRGRTTYRPEGRRHARRGALSIRPRRRRRPCPQPRGRARAPRSASWCEKPHAVTRSSASPGAGCGSGRLASRRRGSGPAVSRTTACMGRF